MELLSHRMYSVCMFNWSTYTQQYFKVNDSKNVSPHHHCLSAPRSYIYTNTQCLGSLF